MRGNHLKQARTRVFLVYTILFCCRKNELRKIFEKFDKDNNKTISVGEARAVLKDFNFTGTYPPPSAKCILGYVWWTHMSPAKCKVCNLKKYHNTKLSIITCLNCICGNVILCECLCVCVCVCLCVHLHVCLS